MATPIKTLILQAIKTALDGMINGDGAALFKDVIRNPSKPIDHDFFKSPMCFIFDETESKTRRNRIADVSLPIQIECWLKIDEDDISDFMDYIEAEVHKEFVNSTDLQLYIKNIYPEEGTPATKFYINETLGGVVLRYNIRYIHEWADPYDSGRQ